MSWNVCGLGKTEKRRIVRRVVLSQKPIVLFLQESKLGVFDSKTIREIEGVLLTRGVGVEAVCRARGLITLWNEEMFTATYYVSNRWCIVLAVVLNKLNKPVVLCNVYASNLESEQKELKLGVFDTKTIREIGGVLLTHGVGVEAVGRAKGLITLWNEEMFTVADCVSNRWCIMLAVVLNRLNKPVVLCNVHASNLESERKELWDTYSSPFLSRGALEGTSIPFFMR
ncbi:hypothetical protein Dsin_013361 [Dipteronia sinensis]|uniref:Uncharacterized protein n=1 Tax=Dipteronia sinensis TaxID=43782 RepID=A0AAE0AJZ4_9ROSI|nr:hypothetical protein Dsin_013361 [Dipteronia sinensis]